MTKDILLDLYKKHNDWIIVVKRLGANNSVAEDLVQDMYIKMHLANKKTLIESIDVYAYFVLRNLYFDYFNKLKVRRKNEVRIDKIIEGWEEYPDRFISSQIEDTDEFCMKTEIEASDKIDQLVKAKDTLLWYDKKVLNLHYSGVTMRALSRDTGISLSSIFNTIKNARNTIKKQLDGIL